MTILDIALAWLAAGVAVIPARIDGSKAPLGTWRQYIEHLPEKDQVVSWFRDGHPGMGLVCGAVSGGLEMVELEGRAIDKLPELQTLAADAGLGGLLNRVMTGYVERTPSGGLHMLYRISDGPVAGNTKLARDSDGLVLAETRGEGGFVIIAPSNGATHPSGRPWTTVVGDAGTVPTLTSDEAEDLRGLFRCLDETPHPELEASPGPALPPTPRSPSVPTALGIGVGISPGDDYEDRTGWADILEPHGWRQIFTRGQVVYWRRPGKESGVSATTGRASDRDRLYVFSSSTPFRTELPYTRFAAFAVLNHGGDYAAAASDLKVRGYGQAPAAPTLTSLARPLSGPVSQDPNVDGEESAVDPVDAMEALLLDTRALDSIPEPEWLIDDLLVRDSPAWLQGKPGHGKSFLALDWAGCVGSGIEWWGRAAVQGLVIYLIAEGVAGTKLRVRTWEIERKREMENVLFLPVAVQVTSPQWAIFIRMVRRLQPVMVVIDTQARVTVGMEENAAKDMGEFVAAIEELQRASHATVLIVHHEGRTGEHMRGSTALEGAAVTLVKVTKEEQTVIMTCLKQKDGLEFDPLEMCLKPSGLSAYFTPGSKPFGSSIVDSAEGHRLWKQWWECFGSDFVSTTTALKTIGMPDTGFYRARQSLLRAGLLRDDGAKKRALWSLVRGPADDVTPNYSQVTPTGA